MERATAVGLAEVAGLLRSMADGIEAGRMTLGEESFPVSEDLLAVVESPEAPSDSMLVALRFEWQHARPGHLAVEHELTHPGG
ncbi:MAG TPA: hypothetical protein VFH58_07660 [Acidimicrobiales bacterium]|nr:hypothetical protein [Acidimicrobiales bacterium]